MVMMIRCRWPKNCAAIILMCIILTTTPSTTAAQSINTTTSTNSMFLHGNLGVLSPDQMTSVLNDPIEFQEAVASAALNILAEQLQLPLQVQPQQQGYASFFAGQPPQEQQEQVLLELRPVTNQKVSVDPIHGNWHVRCQQYLGDWPMEGASAVVHVHGTTGILYALNGEIVKQPSSSTASLYPNGESLDCETAVEIALAEYGITHGAAWESACQEAAVIGIDGNPHLAFKRMIGFQPIDKSIPFQRDVVFASRVTGELLQVHHKTYGALRLATYDCNNSEDERDCDDFISSSPRKISISDKAAMHAHNNVIHTYKIFKKLFGRDSMDDRGMRLETHVHYGEDYRNAFYSNGQTYYGDGDGDDWSYFSRSLEIVTHEFSHGVTDFSSNLIYSRESGALNEAFSDCMGATSERLILKKIPGEVWKIAEDLDLRHGKGFRNMANPTVFGDPDHYSKRYLGDEDNGGVHKNSGIINKWFQLIVEGGRHYGINVRALDLDFNTAITIAAKIFYYANTQCFSEGTNFLAARRCTLLFAKEGFQKYSVHKAWAAVGVTECSNRGAKCSARFECCRQGKKALACDGESNASKICKSCRTRGNSCARSSQCCQKLQCRNETCTT